MGRIYENIKTMEYGGTSHNRPVYASPPVGGSASATARSIASLIPTPLLRHILSALQTLRVCLSGRPKRRKQPERYVTLGLKWLRIYCIKIHINNIKLTY
jgi:hypothetical protein